MMGYEVGLGYAPFLNVNNSMLAFCIIDYSIPGVLHLIYDVSGRVLTNVYIYILTLYAESWKTVDSRRIAALLKADVIVLRCLWLW